MIAQENKYHWYDGWFYDLFIAPNQDKLFGKIGALIEPDKDIIDVGTGTGRFPFFTADRCKSVLGIDLSEKNILRANRNLSKNRNSKISFLHKNIDQIINEGKIQYDYAVMTYVIHEVNESERIELLNKIFKVARKIIIGDYLFPRPKTPGSVLNEAVEFIAGREHYRNFKSYLKNGGLIGLAEVGGFKIVGQIKDEISTSHVIVIINK